MDENSREVELARQPLQLHVARIRRIRIEVAQGTTTWSAQADYAIEVVTLFSLNPEFDRALARRDRLDIISVLQRIAYHKSNGEAITVVADWCSSEWLRLCEENSEDVDALYGMALSWLHRAQVVLYKIYELDQRSSSSSSASARSFDHRRSVDSMSVGVNEEDNEARVNSVDFIQARTALQPATEYFDRALAAAERQHRSPGEEMMLRAAEANISLGNTSSSRSNERHYRRAIELLRQATTEGYHLTPSLRSFFEEFGRFVD